MAGRGDGLVEPKAGAMIRSGKGIRVQVGGWVRWRAWFRVGFG